MRLFAVIVALAGCNQVLGLDETVLAPDPEADGDRDGIPDVRDNCVTVANNDQSDADGDALGDACDGCDQCAPCATPANHDEDTDKLDDGCDNCPAQANPDQANEDGDDLGDACDRSQTTPQQRVLFDGFRTLSDAWFELGGSWAVENGDAIVLPGPTGIAFGISHSAATLEDRSFRIDAAFHQPTEAIDFSEIAVRVISGDASDYLRCAWMYRNGSWQPSLPFVVISLSREGSQLACDVDREPGDFLDQTPVYPARPAITATTRLRLAWIDVIQ